LLQSGDGGSIPVKVVGLCQKKYRVVTMSACRLIATDVMPLSAIFPKLAQQEAVLRVDLGLLDRVLITKTDGKPWLSFDTFRRMRAKGRGNAIPQIRTIGIRYRTFRGSSRISGCREE
jgi:hypothetical protein